MKKRAMTATQGTVSQNQPGSPTDQIERIDAAIEKAVQIGAAAGVRFSSPELRARLLEALAVAEGADGEEEA